MDRHEYKTQNEQRDAQRNEKLLWRYFWKWRPVWWKLPAERFGFFVAVFTGALVLVSYWQFTAIKGQLKEMHEQTITTRSQIRANMVQEDIGHELRYESGQLSGIFFTPHWKNSGATDAINYVGWYRLAIFTGKTNWTAADCPEPRPPTDIPDPIVVQAGHPLSQAGQFVTFDIISDVLKQQGVVFFSGHSEYRDIFPDDPVFHFDWCQRAVINDLGANAISFVIFRQKTN
jgi:hypothetical protein